MVKKCKTKSCKNRSDQGIFVGPYCKPCYDTCVCECGHKFNDHSGKEHCCGTITEGLFHQSFPCSCRKLRPAIPPIHYKETLYGFEFGAADLRRLCSDTKKGWVYLGINTPKTKDGHYSVYVTKTGKVRIFQPDGKEMVTPSETSRLTIGKQ